MGQYHPGATAGSAGEPELDATDPTLTTDTDPCACSPCPRTREGGECGGSRPDPRRRRSS